MKRKEIHMNIVNKIAELEENFAGQAPLNIMVCELNEVGIDEIAISNGINELINKNVIIEVMNGYYRRKL